LLIYGDIMKVKKSVLRPKETRILEALGENIKLLRLRRKLSAELVSERANISRTTLWHVEKGSEHISIGAILRVLSVFNMGDDVKMLGADDELGQKLQDLGLLVKKRAPKG